MEEGRTKNGTSGLELEFNSLSMPSHNLALSNNLPWLVQAHIDESKRLTEFASTPWHQLLVLALKACEGPQQHHWELVVVLQLDHFPAASTPSAGAS